MNDALWKNDSIQFPRLIAEIVATQDIDIEALAISMNLSSEQVNELLERAQVAFQRVAEIHCPEDLFTKKVDD